jgi:hypothetical protein
MSLVQDNYSISRQLTRFYPLLAFLADFGGKINWFFKKIKDSFEKKCYYAI